MPEKGAKTFRFTGLVKGVFAASNPFDQPQGSLPRVHNLVLTERGGLLTIDGTHIISAPPPIPFILPLTLPAVILPFSDSPYTAVLGTTAAFLCFASSTSTFQFDLPAATGSFNFAYIVKMDAFNHAISVEPNGSDEINGLNNAIGITIQYDGILILDYAAGQWVILQ